MASVAVAQPDRPARVPSSSVRRRSSITSTRPPTRTTRSASPSSAPSVAASTPSGRRGCSARSSGSAIVALVLAIVVIAGDSLRLETAELDVLARAGATAKRWSEAEGWARRTMPVMRAARPGSEQLGDDAAAGQADDRQLASVAKRGLGAPRVPGPLEVGDAHRHRDQLPLVRRLRRAPRAVATTRLRPFTRGFASASSWSAPYQVPTSPVARMTRPDGARVARRPGSARGWRRYGPARSRGDPRSRSGPALRGDHAHDGHRACPGVASSMRTRGGLRPQVVAQGSSAGRGGGRPVRRRAP